MRKENEGNLCAPLWVKGGYNTSFREPKALRILFRGDARLCVLVGVKSLLGMILAGRGN